MLRKAPTAYTGLSWLVLVIYVKSDSVGIQIWDEEGFVESNILFLRAKCETLHLPYGSRCLDIGS